jgi:hypothetical protein
MRSETCLRRIRQHIRDLSRIGSDGTAIGFTWPEIGFAPRSHTKSRPRVFDSHPGKLQDRFDATFDGSPRRLPPLSPSDRHPKPIALTATPNCPIGGNSWFVDFPLQHLWIFFPLPTVQGDSGRTQPAFPAGGPSTRHSTRPPALYAWAASPAPHQPYN